QWEHHIDTNPVTKNGVDILTIINNMGYEAYIVGGAVRDLVMDQTPYDIDISTNCPIDVLDKKFRTHDIGKSKDFGIVVIIRGIFNYEIAQFREDGCYNDGRRPESVTICGDFKSDSSRRDLTINAMAIDKDGNIIDHFGGMDDMKNKIIRAVGDPNLRYEEDYLRQLRTIRFAARMDFDVDSDTIDAIKVHKDKIVTLSPERIKDELWKMASQSGDKFVKSLRLMDAMGILRIILPEVSLMKFFKETEHHHPEAYIEGLGSVFDHTMAALKQYHGKDPMVNMSVLLHDIGKPCTHVQDGDRHTYFGHAGEAKEIIEGIAQRLKMSTKEKDSLIFASVNHMKMFRGEKMKPSKIVKLVNDENWFLLKRVSLCDDKCRGDVFDSDIFHQTIGDMEMISIRWGSKTVNNTVKVVDGNRIKELTGLKPCKLLGDIKRSVTEYAIDNDISDDKDIDALIVRFHKELA
ncbi:MAG: CCA tRNA nucleotidyltransferase, partial [Candidatus Peribacteraceae bacterium]|nr:CCA tRNA nucleotidyltransferase [Candidatus Peribacteraceae bacterium]